MFTLTLIVAAFIAGYLCDRFRVKIKAWLVRRAAANKIKAAQALVDNYEKAKAILAANTPSFPPKPTVTP